MSLELIYLCKESLHNNMARTIFTKDPVKFIPALAEALKKVPEFEVPEWANYVKTGVSRERPPAMDDFWYTRLTSPSGKSLYGMSFRYSPRDLENISVS